MRSIFLFVIIGLIEWSSAAQRTPREIKFQKDVGEILKLIPWENLRKICEDHAKNDKEFRDVIKYLRGSEWRTSLNALNYHQDVMKVKDIFKQSGMDLDVIFQDFEKDLKKVDIEGGYSTKDLKMFWNEIKKELPVGKLIAEVFGRMETDGNLKDLFNIISTQDFHELFENLRKQPEMIKIMEYLTERNINVNDYVSSMEKLFGWGEFKDVKMVNRRLRDDLDNVQKFVSWKKINDITKAYLGTQKEFGDFITFVKNADWTTLLDVLKTNTDWINFKEFLLEEGIKFDEMFSYLFNLIKHTTPPAKATGTKTLKHYVDEVSHAVDIQKISEYLTESLHHNVNFKIFYSKISSPTAFKMFEHFQKYDEFQMLLTFFHSEHVKSAKSLIYELMEWTHLDVKLN